MNTIKNSVPDIVVGGLAFAFGALVIWAAKMAFDKFNSSVKKN